MRENHVTDVRDIRTHLTWKNLSFYDKVLEQIPKKKKDIFTQQKNRREIKDIEAKCHKNIVVIYILACHMNEN